MILSASQVEAFDPALDNPFACKTRWWLEHLGGHDSGKDWGKDKGTAVHETLESFLKGEPQGCLHELVIGAPGALEFLIPLRKRIRFVEATFKPGKHHPPLLPWLPPVRIGGIDFSGRVDWLATDTDGRTIDLGDHKTTSNISKYAKTVGQLKKSPQMNIYARWLQQFESWEQIRLSQDFYQTKGAKKFDLVSTILLKRENDSRIQQIEATVEEMVKVSQVSAPEKVEPNLKACRIGYGCPHRAYCPHVKEFSMTSLLDMFTAPAPIPATEPSAPVPTPAAPSPKTEPSAPLPAPAAGVVLPADAPASAPASTLPPETVPEPAAPSKRGRKPGSKNKTAADEPPPNQVSVVPSIPSLGPVAVREIKIRHDVKVGMPNFSSAGVQVEFGGTIQDGASVEEARASLSLQVRNAMVKELEVYQPKKEESK